MTIYLSHHLSQLPNCDFVVGVANIENVAIGSRWIFLRKKNHRLQSHTNAQKKNTVDKLSLTHNHQKNSFNSILDENECSLGLTTIDKLKLLTAKQSLK